MGSVATSVLVCVKEVFKCLCEDGTRSVRPITRFSEAM